MRTGGRNDIYNDYCLLQRAIFAARRIDSHFIDILHDRNRESQHPAFGLGTQVPGRSGRIFRYMWAAAPVSPVSDTVRVYDHDPLLVRHRTKKQRDTTIADWTHSSAQIALHNYHAATLQKCQAQLEDYSSRITRVNNDLRTSITAVTSVITDLSDKGLAHHLPISA